MNNVCENVLNFYEKKNLAPIVTQNGRFENRFLACSEQVVHLDVCSLTKNNQDAMNLCQGDKNC